MTFVVVEGGMSSGEPAVEIVSTSQNGTVLLATSLDKLIMACSGMIGMAEKLWGWKQPEGYATIMPGLNREKRKEILESIKKELEEWDEVEDG